MRRWLLAGIFCLLAMTLAARTDDRLAAADSVAAIATAMLPAGQPVYLEVTSDEWSTLLSDRLKTRILAGGLRLLNRESADGVILQLDCSTESVKRKSLLDLSGDHVRHRFSIQVTDSATGQILSWKTHDWVESTDDARSDHLRWYDPILVSAVIGGLVYLFYFGAK
jgi:hypothetical protein